MPDLNSGINSGLAAGLATGSPLIGIGVGLLGAATSESPEAQRTKRYQQLLKDIAMLRTRRIQDINKFTIGQQKTAAGRSGEQAAAMGRVGDVSTFALPAQAEIANQGARNIATSENELDQATLQAASEYANRPIMPSWSDTLANAGFTYIQKQQNDKNLEMQRQRNAYLAKQTGVELPPDPTHNSGGYTLAGDPLIKAIKGLY